MDPQVFTVVLQNPAAAAVIVVVIYFLRSIDKIITQFQQILAEEKRTQRETLEHFESIFEGQREALNLIASHIKGLSEMMVQHDGWEREVNKAILQNQERVITRKMKAVRPRKEQ